MPSELFNTESFDKAFDLGEHFEVRLTNGKIRKLRKNVVGNDLTLEQYRAMILHNEWILIQIKTKEGQPLVPDENGVLQNFFPSFLHWKHEQGPEAAEGTKWMEGGMSRFITIKPIKNGDPNNGQTVYETLYSWAFPSLNYGRISKNQFGRLISYAEAKEIANLTGPGLTLHGLVGLKEKPFSAALSWDLTGKRVLITYLDSPALAASTADENEGVA